MNLSPGFARQQWVSGDKSARDPKTSVLDSENKFSVHLANMDQVHVYVPYPGLYPNMDIGHCLHLVLSGVEVWDFAR